MAAVTICSGFGAQEKKVSYCFHCFLIYLPEVMEPDAMILVFWRLSFKPAFSVSSFTFIKRLFHSSLLSAIRVVSSAYLRFWCFSWQSWFQLVLPPGWQFTWCTLHKLNQQSDNIHPWRTPFPIWSQFVVPCLVLTVASLTAYRFLRRQVRWSGIPISLRIFHSLLWSIQSKALFHKWHENNRTVTFAS